MINKTFIQSLKKSYDAHNKERRLIISQANIALHDSKRAIFSLHRGDLKTAASNLENIEKIFVGIEKKFGSKRANEEGAYRAALEEYAEAKLFFFFNNGQKIGKINEVKIGYESYLGGLCDFTGELVRLATNLASRGKMDKVAEVNETIQAVMAELINFDLTGYLRTKYDQAKNNLRKMEQINYELSLRK